MTNFDKLNEIYKFDLTQYPLKIGGSREREFTKILNNFNFTVGAEVGVADGQNAENLLKRVKGLRLYLVDPWENYPEYKDYIGVDLNEIYKIARERLNKYEGAQFVREYSLEAAHRFEDESLDFVYIDANHGYESCYEDIKAWHAKVKVGGIISGHDYGNMKGKPEDRYGVIRAVDQWVKENNLKLILLWKNTIKSWMYIKE